jgi:hypothetical protein
VLAGAGAAGAVDAGAGAVLAAAGAAAGGSFLPQALSVSRPVKVMLYRAAERAESFMMESVIGDVSRRDEAWAQSAGCKA